MGLFDWVSDRVSQLYHGAVDKVGHVLKTIQDRGATLLTGTHYVGPFNRLDTEYLISHPPTDKVDESALAHDFDYSRIAATRDAGKINHSEAKKLIRESDERFIENTRKHHHANPWAATLGRLGIQFKNKLEDIGWLNPNSFVTQ
jgi:hypothetical protein